jgi:hypothetical protein
MDAEVSSYDSNVVVLEVAWGGGGRWFRINPQNFTGRRLHSAFGDLPFVVTNACPEVVGHSSERGTPNASWLRHNLAALRPRFVLVCGRVAESTFSADMVDSRCVVLFRRHPAARTWTRLALLSLGDDVRRGVEKSRLAFDVSG